MDGPLLSSLNTDLDSKQCVSIGIQGSCGDELLVCFDLTFEDLCKKVN